MYLDIGDDRTIKNKKSYYLLENGSYTVSDVSVICNFWNKLNIANSQLLLWISYVAETFTLRLVESDIVFDRTGILWTIHCSLLHILIQNCIEFSVDLIFNECLLDL